jgi:hypothetical protein
MLLGYLGPVPCNRIVGAASVAVAEINYLEVRQVYNLMQVRQCARGVEGNILEYSKNSYTSGQNNWGRTKLAAHQEGPMFHPQNTTRFSKTCRNGPGPTASLVPSRLELADEQPPS